LAPLQIEKPNNRKYEKMSSTSLKEFTVDDCHFEKPGKPNEKK
jgi:hypothetical protein